MLSGVCRNIVPISCKTISMSEQTISRRIPEHSVISCFR
ncbi:unnamed protein product [Acanthoscelides obtectus]|uniref:Uncharacterized protein n=1 Tax=Acanthoscelides obtectus TaxID=200917 RepID=A0A9P0K502_ACAOB|nr:unnamed protein product [Acanthoscelides obtectus]CAK1628800.1 hypothetical protein AOBTE_LOCUS5408 [Acanthoscelides obtectus]